MLFIIRQKNNNKIDNRKFEFDCGYINDNYSIQV